MQCENDPDAGSIAHIADGIAVLRVPMRNSYAIPLEILVPCCVDLLAWCFVDFDKSDDFPAHCLLVVSCSSDFDFRHCSSVTLRTHIRDRLIRLLEAPVPLSSGETLVLAQAVLAAVAPNTVHRLAALLPALAPELDAICADSSASCDCELVWSENAGAPVAVGLDYVPTCLIARESGGYTYAVVEAVRMRAGPRAAMKLTLASPLDLRRPGDAILIGSGRYGVARIAGAK